MREEELARFALVLKEARRVRAQIAEDEAAARANNRGDDLLASSIAPEGEQSFGPAMVAA